MLNPWQNVTSNSYSQSKKKLKVGATDSLTPSKENCKSSIGHFGKECIFPNLGSIFVNFCLSFQVYNSSTSLKLLFNRLSIHPTLELGLFLEYKLSIKSNNMLRIKAFKIHVTNVTVTYVKFLFLSENYSKFECIWSQIPFKD